jgi:hypothetical protein
MLPGDENDANAPTGDAHQGNNNGYFNENTGYAMEDLRLAELISGSGTVTALPTHAYGGTLSLQYTNIGGGSNRNQVVATNIPAEVCQEIDSKYDDGAYNTGDIRGSAAYTAGTDVANFGWKF